MDFNEYQKHATETAVFTNEFYPMASLVVEASELIDLFVKPMLRGDEPKATLREDVISEAGDVLWNLAVLLDRQGIDFSEVAYYNLAKLQDRAKRGVLKGSGDNR